VLGDWPSVCRSSAQAPDDPPSADFFPSQYILPPSRVLAQPDKDQLAERFPEGIEQVQQEHAEDAALLESYIEETDIERYVGSIMNA
jgi:hypothetical protein